MPSSAKLDKRIFAATLASALLLLLVLEIQSPYYFLQDDSLEFHLAAFVHNWHSLLSGELPLYNFHTFAGVPHASMGQEAPFYLPEYLALFLSQTIWGHLFAAIDLMAIMHALLAVAGGYFLLRFLGTSDMVASFGALTALSGFFLWCGRDWITATMLCAWFPWMVWAALRYLEQPSYGRAGWLMFFRLGLLYGGHSQFFVLALIFEHLFGLSYSLVTRSPKWRIRCGQYAALNVPTFLLGLPLVLPLYAEVGRSLLRSTSLSYEDFSSLNMPSEFWLFGQLFVFLRFPSLSNIVSRSFPFLSYIGYVPTVLSCGAYTLSRRHPSTSRLLAACTICFSVALLWTWGLLDPIVYHIPVLNRFRLPFKLVYFAGFFQCILAALVLEHWSKRWQRVAIAGFVLNWLLVFCLLPTHAWRIRDYDPPLKSPWQESLEGGRYFVISHGAVSRESKEFVEFNYSMLWGLDNLLGYEPMLSRLGSQAAFGDSMRGRDLHGGSYDGPVDQRLLEHLKTWSVKYVLVGSGRADASATLAAAGFQRRAVRHGWTLWQDPKYLPRVRWNEQRPDFNASAGIVWSSHTNSIDVSLSEWPSRHLVLAFTANPGLQACVGNACTPVVASADHMVHIDVPEGTRHVRLVYRNSLFTYSFSIALATLAAIGTLAILSRRRRRKSAHADEQPLADRAEATITQ